MTSLVESYFGLKRPPFSISESSGPVFMTEPLRSSAVFLRDGLAAGTPVLGVMGAAGIGKSSLARALPKLTAGSVRIAAMSGRARSWEDLRQVLMREFEIGRDRITRDGLAEARAKYGKLLIVVDDAQYLTPNLLERICIMPQLRTDADEPAVQVLLLADLDAVSREDIRPLLAWLDANTRHIMQPVPAEDAHRYIDTHMRRAGWKGEPLVCESGASALHRLSRGNPRRLSIVCMEVLEQAATRGIARVDAEFVVGCSSADVPECEEPLSAPSGAALSDEIDRETRSGQSLELSDDSWDQRFDRAPLTAENIAVAPSIELANVAESLRRLQSLAPPIESMRAVSRPLLRTMPPPFKPHNPRNQKQRGLFFLGFCALVAAAAVYTSRAEVAELIREAGMNLLTVADVVGSAEIEGEASAAVSAGAVDRAVAVQLQPARDLVLHGSRSAL
ncbi:MAG: AAA family ATPase [Deltaproteobacteria bacterium]|nr:AAA family ATPase [Deltaproteobacteria bacterium]